MVKKYWIEKGAFNRFGKVAVSYNSVQNCRHIFGIEGIEKPAVLK